METIGAERETLRPKSGDDAARKRVAVETYAQNETTLRRTARRYSLCADDVEEALQRSLEILLRKAPSDDPLELIKWMQTVVKHEALAVRRERERDLAGPAAAAAPDDEDWVALLPAAGAGPAEQVERREEIARSREALQALKPQELRALTLFGEGYSYAEIGQITSWSHTKINRCLAEGRERLRRLIAQSEAGGRCKELQPLLSSFCDGQVSPGEVAKLREHLRACAHCRATLRAYRLAPKAAAALAPLPLHRSLWERAQEAASNLAGRFSGGGEPVAQVATGGTGGGAVAILKIAAVCIGTAGGAAACVAGGLVPAPGLGGEGAERSRMERRLVDAPAPEAAPAPKVDYEPAEPDPKPDPKPKPAQEPVRQQPVETEPASSEPAPVSTAPVESAPVAEPEPEPAPAPAPVESGGGSAAGEFGP